MDNIERIEELQEKRNEFIFSESVYKTENPSWGEVSEAQGEAEVKWLQTDEGKELKALEIQQGNLSLIIKEYASEKSAMAYCRERLTPELLKERFGILCGNPYTGGVTINQLDKGCYQIEIHCKLQCLTREINLIGL